MLRERLQGRLFTVSVGSREASHAQSVASSSGEVLALLEQLCAAPHDGATPGGGAAASPRLSHQSASPRHNPPPSPLINSGRDAARFSLQRS